MISDEDVKRDPAAEAGDESGPVGAEGATGDSEEDGDEDGEDEGGDDAASSEVETAEYKILGLVDTFDEQMNITGQLPVGSVQTLPVAYGDKQVELGHAERVE